VPTSQSVVLISQRKPGNVHDAHHQRRTVGSRTAPPGQVPRLRMRYQGRFKAELAQELQRLNQQMMNSDLIIAPKQVPRSQPSADASGGNSSGSGRTNASVEDLP